MSVMLRFLGHRIADQRIIGLVRKWLVAVGTTIADRPRTDPYMQCYESSNVNRRAPFAEANGKRRASDLTGVRILSDSDHPFSSETDHLFSRESDQCSRVNPIAVLL
jgi:hypothetical protein